MAMNLSDREKASADRIDARATDKWWTRLENSGTALFPPNSPNRDDVTQKFMGNCFFLASVLSLMLRRDGATHVANHMQDEGEWVYARLYDGNDTGRLMKAKKQACNMKNPGGGSSIRTEPSALWVSMLQVFASAFVLYNSDAGKVTYDKLNPSLNRLNDGYASSALKVLTGKNVGVQGLSSGWAASFKAKFNSGYPMVINSKRAAALQAMFPGAGAGAALNHVTVNGIVGGHSYAVWDIQQKNFGSGPIDAVRIVNPWGHYKQTNYTTTDNATFSWHTDGVSTGGDFWLPLALVPNFFVVFFWAEKPLGVPVV